MFASLISLYAYYYFFFQNKYIVFISLNVFQWTSQIYRANSNPGHESRLSRLMIFIVTPVPQHRGFLCVSIFFFFFFRYHAACMCKFTRDRTFRSGADCNCRLSAVKRTRTFSGNHKATRVSVKTKIGLTSRYRRCLIIERNEW